MLNNFQLRDYMVGKIDEHVKVCISESLNFFLPIVV